MFPLLHSLSNKKWFGFHAAFRHEICFLLGGGMLFVFQIRWHPEFTTMLDRNELCCDLVLHRDV